MTMIEVKTADLIGPALDWAVAEAIGQPKVMLKGKPFALFGSIALPFSDPEKGYAPSTCWHCGGPLIEKCKISLHCPQHAGDVWAAWREDEFVVGATTALQAACRAIVRAKAGEIVQVPKELMP